ncbi:MAG: helix-turn-helix domain-containing protein [Nitrosopumilaceae archaeon]
MCAQNYLVLKSDIIVPYLSELNNMIGKPWTLRILLELRRAKRIRYNDLLELLEGISSSTLSINLKNLQKNGLITRKSSGKNIPFRVEYSLTEKGFDFVIACYPLLKWAVKTNHIKNLIPIV